ncbi:hypothetical protein JRO89_XS09G0234500 [Xanthoceras sorbifolium]|uniref:DUF4220 domain-containing protein n=1 Tax=Xanthoceras sorbifolium TaxID=99658 RepID=A0ABQ8HMP0_9ROSI|nr:hypothetical protein JRO89_XS09G0234500 [Xanthoceras sorbifolium]
MRLQTVNYNKLWKRQLLGVVVQTLMAFYALFMVWTGSLLSVLSLLMFVPGLIKYGERTWVLRSASDYQRPIKKEEDEEDEDEDEDVPKAKFFKIDTMNFKYHLEDYKIKNMEGYVVGVDRIVEAQLPLDISGCNICEPLSQEDKLVAAFGLLDTDKLLFVDSTLDTWDRDKSKTVFRNMSFGDAFEVIEIELGLIYDWLYTKFPFLYTRWGIGLLFITFFLTCSELVLFAVLIDKDKYSKVDVSITFILLAVAIMLEIYAVVLVLSSDRFRVWLIMHSKTSTIKALTSFPLAKGPRWSNKLFQQSLLSFMISKKQKPLFSCKFLSIIGLDMRYRLRDCEVSKYLRKLIFLYVKQKAEEATRTGQVLFTAFPKSQGGLQDSNNGAVVPGTSIREAFAYNIVIWHIATEVWYFLLDREHISRELCVYCKSMKQLSRYMMYLLLEHPSMLSAEIRIQVIMSQISFEEIIAQVNDETDPAMEVKIPTFLPGSEYFSSGDNSNEPDEQIPDVKIPEEFDDEFNDIEASDEQLPDVKFPEEEFDDEYNDIEASDEGHSSLEMTRPEADREEISQSASFRIVSIEDADMSTGEAMDSDQEEITRKRKACSQLLRNCSVLANRYSNKSSIVFRKAMEIVKTMNTLPQEKKWETIGYAWLEMLVYAARKSKVDEHAEQLRHGGEFLTHVWLLLAHFGLTDHFEDTSGEEHQIARLIAK